MEKYKTPWSSDRAFIVPNVLFRTALACATGLVTIGVYEGEDRSGPSRTIYTGAGADQPRVRGDRQIVWKPNPTREDKRRESHG